jgi:hypothetical protein
MAVVDFLQHRVQLAPLARQLPHAEDLGNDVGGQSENGAIT